MCCFFVFFVSSTASSVLGKLDDEKESISVALEITANCPGKIRKR